MTGLAPYISGALGWWPLVIAFLGSLGIGSMLKTWLDHRLGMRKATDDMATTTVQTLTDRVAVVEGELKQERALCDAQLAVLRHRMNNLAQSFDALLLMVEMAPEKAAEFVVRIKEQRARQEVAEAEEKKALLAMKLAMATGNLPPDETMGLEEAG